MIVILLGPPGVGKGTQGQRISIHYSLPTISTGVMFRDAVARGTELGRIIQRYKIDKGEFVPDEVVIQAVKARTLEADCANGFLLDGFPRTIPQAVALETMLLNDGHKLTGVLNFEAPIADIVKRFSGRRVCPRDGSSYHIETQPPMIAGLCDLCGTALVQRPDDDPDVVKRRLEVYMDKTKPLVTYYGKCNVLYTVDADAAPETVFSSVIAVLNKLRK